MAIKKLRDLAYARSGDKGDVANVGLLAFNAENYAILTREVTPERVKRHFGEMVKGPVEIYEMPNIQALEVILRNAIDGGATRTLRFDQTAKAMGTALLRMEIDV
jgi:hypothetical protein